MKVFHPDAARTIYVPASAPHPANTEYRVALGHEEWGGAMHPVLKVQMVYNGLVAGRRAPSYPMGTDDYERVQAAIAELLR